ncbi:ubiquitin-specific protease [Saccharomycopsis crataegensis]|uniref:Ubiquitin-specific protease n=1 Tax=Saccharomycopsis crataegensis TaxID=43959 RepID=A0AAV5QS24_9ASCO|nr:ubiquitin-specific protease [Saccharomycopsis crataegensis]
MSGKKSLPKSKVPVLSDKKDGTDKLDFVTFSSCDHLKKLLASPAKDLVVRNYNLSLKVSCLAYPQPGLKYSNMKEGNHHHNAKLNGSKVGKKTLPTAGNGVSTVSNIDNKKLLKLRSAAVKCSSCKNNLSVNLICLQCPFVGCFNNRHGLAHSQSTHHLFAISTFGQVFCYKCNNYVSDPELEEIRVGSLKSIGRLSAAPGMPVYPFMENRTPEAKKFILENSRAPSFKATTGLKGFVNMGATCYMSTILQTFIHNPFVREYFLSGDHAKCIKGLTNDDSCVTCRIDEVFTDFFTSSSVNGFGLTKFLSTCWKINKSLAGYTQQDAHEFWQFVLGEFHKSHMINSSHGTEPKVNVNNHARSSSISYGSNDHHCECLTHRVFSGELQSSIKCHECGNVNKTVDPMIDLLLEIKNKSTGALYGSLNECLGYFTKPESLESNYNCNNCESRTDASKKLSIKKMGSILTIQLKRFEHLAAGGSVKLEHPVSYPVILDMAKYCTNTTAGQKVVGELSYELFAIVCHIGQVNQGHYICMIKNGEGQWFKFDDSMVTLISQQEALATSAYLLFYIQHQFP